MPEEVKQSKHKDTLDKIDKQINRVEETINSLLEDIDMEMINHTDRLHIAVKFMAQHSRLIMLKESVETDEPEKRESTLMLAFQRHLRGEKPGEVDG